MNDLAKLNRMRVNAGKTELKSWKASQSKLDEAIKAFEAQGITDALPGANINVKPKTDDPEVAKARPEPKKDKKSKKEPPAPAEEKAPETKPEPTVTKVKAQLGKGLENEPMARQSREAVRQERLREKAEEKAAAKEAKKAGKEEKLPKGAVDPKKDPAKAERQKKHIEDKKRAREGKPKKDKNPNEITLADLARELNKDAKIIRAKARRHLDKLEKLQSKDQIGTWNFPLKAKPDLIKILG